MATGNKRGKPQPKRAESHRYALRKPPVAPPLDFPSDVTATAAYRYGQLSRSQCKAELETRHVPYMPETARGVLAPIRLTGPLHGVLFRGNGSDQERGNSIHEIIDCRLVLALDDVTELLRERGIVEVRHYSIYRLPADSWPKGKPAARHMGGLAIDAGLFIHKNGRILDVDKHFHGAIGAQTCGPGARPRPATAEAMELRALLCAIVDRRLFNVVLTPNYNAPHKNHFHLEVTAGKQWFLIH